MLEKRNLPLLTGFLFFVVFTVIVMIVGLVGGRSPGELLKIWQRGSFSVLEFSMLSILLWMSIACIVHAPPTGRVLRNLSGSISSHGRAGMLIAFISLILGWVNWLLGMLIGLSMAREIARENLEKGNKLHYPYLVSCAFSASAVGLLGPLSPVQLYLADKIAHIGPAKALVPIAISKTVFSSVSLIISLIILISIPIALYLMRPRGNDVSIISEEELKQPRADEIVYYKPKPKSEAVFADKLEASIFITMVTGIAGLASILYFLLVKGAPFTFRNAMFLLFMLGLLLNIRPVEYALKMRETAKASGYIPALIMLAAGFCALTMDVGLYNQLSSLLSAWGAFVPVFAFILGFVLAIVLPEPSSMWLVANPLLVGAAPNVTVLLVIALMCGFMLSRFLQPSYHLAVYGFSAANTSKYLKVIMAISMVVYVVIIIISSYFAFGK